MQKEFEEAAFALVKLEGNDEQDEKESERRKISGIVSTASGVHLIKLIDTDKGQKSRPR